MFCRFSKALRAVNSNNNKCFIRFASSEAGLDASKLTIVKTQSPQTKNPIENLEFGKDMTDHMFYCDYEKGKGWGTPKIVPFGPFEIHPASTVLHYAMECFEGMKAYKDSSGKPIFFRPDMNMNRFYNSSARLALPTFSKNELQKCIGELVKLDSDWIPNKRGFSLYIRPTMIGTQESLGVGPSSKARLFVICSPVGPYFKTGFAPVSLLADPRFVRAWPGGAGDIKCGGNYAPGVVPQAEAAKQGYNQILWLYGENHEITEVGTMNLFTLWINKNGEKELITAPLDGTILPGVTRDSILQLCREWGDFKVSEKKYTIFDIKDAVAEGRMIEMFGAGTACIVCPVKNIGWEGKDIPIPLAKGNAGELTLKLNDTIMDIQYAEKQHNGWSVEC